MPQIQSTLQIFPTHEGDFLNLLLLSQVLSIYTILQVIKYLNLLKTRI